MIEVRGSSVFLAADTRRYPVHGRLAKEKGKTAEELSYAIQEGSGLTQNMRQTVTVVERYLRYRSCEE